MDICPKLVFCYKKQDKVLKFYNFCIIFCSNNKISFKHLKIASSAIYINSA